MASATINLPRPASASASTSPSPSPSPSQRSTTPRRPLSTALPVRKIPGDTGIPLISPIRDRLDYFYFKGRDNYFKSQIQKLQSTVFRTNMPPGPFISTDPRVIALLDAHSFPTLFDLDKVDKSDVFTGTYTPHLSLTGGHRVLSYLDPTDPKHTPSKTSFSTSSCPPATTSSPNSTPHSDAYSTNSNPTLPPKAKWACFNFIARSLFNTDPSETDLGTDGPSLIQKWVLFQLSPVLSLGLPWFIEDPLIHTFRLPPFLVKKDYERLYNFFNKASSKVLDEAEKMGLDRDEACHNILFATCFNTFGGFKVFFPTLFKWLGRSGSNLHSKLAAEIRGAVKSNGGSVTMAAMEQMPLMKSAVYEAFRVEPPVPLQYGRAKRDLVVESHDASFEVNRGEMLFGFQPFATRDSRIFERAEEYVAERFVGEEGESLLKYVLWSNGRETDNPTVDNKQCAGKDLVVLASRLLVVELFLRYDSFDIEVGKSPIGLAITITSLKRASSVKFANTTYGYMKWTVGPRDEYNCTTQAVGIGVDELVMCELESYSGQVKL
ncbi:hypothetical protein Syun_015765 [Stephania yunnanensis]|uniref:Allene oxide synthase n=1 Tax=Stephania yunnanensis TaxID=152371 RepID=A0AAP0PDA8_9MAGN